MPPTPQGGPPPLPQVRRQTGAAAGRAWQAATGGIARAGQTIAGRLEALERRQLVLRTGSLTASTATTATITLGGASISGVNMLASYTPTTGDTVLVLQSPGVLIIIGRAK